MFALAGVGNTVYHPADYAMLSHHVPARPHRPGIFGAHLRRHARVGGGAGKPVADAEPVGLARRLYRRRRARLCGGGVCCWLRDGADAERGAPPRAPDDARRSAGGFCLSPPILLNLVFFVLLAMMSGGMYNYSVVALGALYETPVSVANAALSGQSAAVGDRRAGRRPAGRPHHAARPGGGARLAAIALSHAADRACRSRLAGADRGDGGWRLLLRASSCPRAT